MYKRQVLLLAAVFVITVSGNASVGPAAAPAVIPAPDDTATGIEPAAGAGPTMADMDSAAGPEAAFGDGDAFSPTSMEADTELVRPACACILLHPSVAHLGPLSYKYCSFLTKTVCWLSDRAVPPELQTITAHPSTSTDLWPTIRSYCSQLKLVC